MDKKEELKSLIKEVVTEAVGSDMDSVRAEAEAQKEANAKILEDNTELKAKFDAMQEKVVTLTTNTAGDQEYIFKGYDATRPTRNFKIKCSKEIGDEVAGIMVKALTEGNTGAYAVPVEYSTALLGLAELSSVALSKARIMNVSTNSIKIPTKGTRGSVDAQGFGTANTDTAATLGQLTFTVDKRVGSYITLNDDLLADSMFDVVGDFVEPMIAEAIGQDFDNEMFNGVEYTTSVSSATAGVTVSGSVAMAAAITYANIVSMAYGPELERGLRPEWYMPRGALKDVVGLVSASTGSPIFNPVPISAGAGGTLLGYPINIVPQISNTPADGSIRMGFGDASQYMICINGGIVFKINPYIKMAEGQTQAIGYARSDGNVVTVDAWSRLKRTDA